MRVLRTNPSLRGLGCSCNDVTFGQGGMAGLGMDSYSVASWNPPGQGVSEGFFGNNALKTSGTAANAIATSTADPPTPTGQAVFDAFSNNYGGVQPGHLPIYPNGTADNLSFVQTPPPSLQCQLVSTMNANAGLFVVGTLALFWMLNKGHHKVREYHAKRKAKAS